MNIKIYPDPILLKSSSEIKNIDKGLVDLINSMVNTMREAEGIGLAAPQVGVLKRVFVCQDFSDEWFCKHCDPLESEVSHLIVIGIS